MVYCRCDYRSYQGVITGLTNVTVRRAPDKVPTCCQPDISRADHPGGHVPAARISRATSETRIYANGCSFNKTIRSPNSPITLRLTGRRVVRGGETSFPPKSQSTCRADTGPPSERAPQVESARARRLIENGLGNYAGTCKCAR